MVTSNSTTVEIVASPVGNSTFFEGLSTKLSGVSLIRSNLINDINTSYSSLTLKNESFFKFNSSLLSDFKTISFFF